MQGAGAAGPVDGRPTRRPYVPFTITTSALVLKLSALTDKHCCAVIVSREPTSFCTRKPQTGYQESCWKEVYAAPGRDGGSHGGNMADTAPCSPRHLHKRRRLSQLLDKLSDQLRNNNHYSLPHWLLFDTQTKPDKIPGQDLPLDLSVKAEPPAKEKFTCNACGQSFEMHDRLAKHVASRHRTRDQEPLRAYECEVCQRRFARSDMLTRHARLHSGIKPYSCASCGQVFSRSDHLATHQRTHTGEKPYHCPSCPYSACRRDMITRHMRTHARRSQPA